MTLEAWLEAARADAERRGLPALGPLLDGLAQSTRALRAATFNDAADGPTPTTPAPPAVDRGHAR